MSPRLARVAGLVAAVADGWSLDWDALVAQAGDDRTRKALVSLKIVAAVARFHRHLPSDRRAAGRDRRSSDGPRAAGPAPPIPAACPAIGKWGRFVLLKKLGEGAYGDVYQAYDAQLDRDVALKLLKPCRSPAEPTTRLLAEARMLARVRHPNVASVYGAGEYDGRAGLWMELVRGANLEDLLCSRGPMSACEASLVGLDLCRALAAVHGAGLVHRDVKTSNVLREVGGRIVLTDFGAGHLRGLEAGHRVAGTPLYLAPEVLAGSEPTALSDIYSLGVVLFRLVSVDFPRRAPRLGDLVQGLSVPTPASLRDLRPEMPDAFAEAVERALAFDPAERPQSAGALRAALGAVLGASGSWRKARRCPAATPADGAALARADPAACPPPPPGGVRARAACA